MNTAQGVRIVVLIDALGWTYLQGREFLSDVLPYRIPLRTVLGYSSAAIPTLLTGEPPAVHGHWNLFYYDPEGSPFRWLRAPARLLPKRLLDNRYGRKLLKELGRRWLGLGPLFECVVSPHLLPFFNFVEKRNIYEPEGISGAPSIFDRLKQAGVDYRVYTYHRWSDREILEQAARDVAGPATFLFLYLSEIDALLHMHCDEKELLDERFREYEEGLRKVFAAARRRDPDARLVLCSDHGMTPIRDQHDLVSEVRSLGLRMPKDYLSVYDSTMARFWFFSSGARERVEERLRSLPYGRILGDAELERLGVLFADRRYGELVFLLEPGALIASSDFNGAGWKPTGMHGYHPDDAWSDGVFLADREPSAPVRGIADACAFALQA